MIGVVIVDDHPVFRDGLRFTLSRAADIEVLGECGSGDEVPEAVERLDPDVVLMDLAMPGVDGLTAARRLTTRGARPAVLVMTMSDDDANVLAAIRAGARGYLLKGAEAEHVTGAVRAVAQGQAVFGAALAGRMLELFASPHQTPGSGEVGGTARSAATPLTPLSPREQEVLTYVAEGLSNQQIADVMVISPITVRNHVSSILSKLQVATRRDAMLFALGAHDTAP
ncbi:MAG: response regulator transcription factor [Actinomycetota bacterium]|nr:response regulator transcription factor [Actinomycetota bacterium]